MERYLTHKRKRSTPLTLSIHNRKTSTEEPFLYNQSIGLAFYERKHVAQIPFYLERLEKYGAVVWLLERKETWPVTYKDSVIVVTDDVKQLKEHWTCFPSCWDSPAIKADKTTSKSDNGFSPRKDDTVAEQLTDDMLIRKRYAQSIPIYSCQRRTRNEPCANEELYQLLLKLEQCRTFDLEHRIHALAYRKAAAVLKVYPFPLKSVEEASWLPCFGPKCLKAVGEYLLSKTIGECVEFDKNERYRCLRMFCGIHGVGPTTASIWYDKYHLRSLEDVKQFLAKKREEGKPLVIKEYGLQYYDDLQETICIEEATEIFKCFLQVDDSLECVLVGSFRRGVQYGHDIDIIGCHTIEENGHLGKLSLILKELSSQYTLISFQHDSINKELSKPNDWVDSSSDNDDQDSFPEQFMGILLYPTKDRKVTRRVDIIMTKKSEFPFTVLSWTGSSFFERDLRRYCAKKNLRFNAHGLFDQHGKKRVLSVPVMTSLEDEEKIIFHFLGLDYLKPEERCA
eukprot:jgi/Galph1/2532/GphlegSOOS_G1203.1